MTAESYTVDRAYTWYNEEKGSMIVRMYFLNNIPFTFDELPMVICMIKIL